MVSTYQDTNIAFSLCVCLLDEVGKLIEKIIADRFNLHLCQVSPDILEYQI